MRLLLVFIRRTDVLGLSSFIFEFLILFGLLFQVIFKQLDVVAVIVDGFDLLFLNVEHSSYNYANNPYIIGKHYENEQYSLNIGEWS